MASLKRQDEENNSDGAAANVSVGMTEGRGRGLFASAAMKEGSTILIERPLVGMQSLDNAKDVTVCRNCLGFAGDVITQLEVLSGLPRRECLDRYQEQQEAKTAETASQQQQQSGQLSGLCECLEGCGELYCSSECRSEHWERCHRLLCVGPVPEEDAQSHPLVAFRVHAMQTNEIFLLVGEVMAQIASTFFRGCAQAAEVDDISTESDSVQQLALTAAVAPFADFVQEPWWEIAVPSDGPDAAATVVGDACCGQDDSAVECSETVGGTDVPLAKVVGDACCGRGDSAVERSKTVGGTDVSLAKVVGDACCGQGDSADECSKTVGGTDVPLAKVAGDACCGQDDSARECSETVGGIDVLLAKVVDDACGGQDDSARECSETVDATDIVVPLADTLRALCEESSALLRSAFALSLGPLPAPLELALSAERFGRMVGTFEQNNVGVRAPSPIPEILRQLLEDGEAGEGLEVVEEAAELVSDIVEGGWGCRVCSDDEDEQPTEKSGGGYALATFRTAVDDSDSSSDDSGESSFAGDDAMATLRSAVDDDDSSDDSGEGLFAPLDGTALYSLVCCMNHSCRPNCVVLYPGRRQGAEQPHALGTAAAKAEPLVVDLVLLEDVSAGDELTQSYVTKEMGLAERRRALEDYGFVCTCPRCCEEEAAAVLSS